MINISFATQSNSAAQLESRGKSAEKSNAAADKANFDAAIGAGVDSGAQKIGIILKPNSGVAADQALTQPHAMLQLLPLGPLVAGHKVGDAEMGATASGAPGLLVAQQKAAERAEGRSDPRNEKAHANPALRPVFDVAVANRRADLEVPSTLASGMEAGRERLVRDMQHELADPSFGRSSFGTSSASSSSAFTAAPGGASGVNANPITAPMPPLANGSPVNPLGLGQSGSSNVAPTNAPMTISLSPASGSPAGSSAQAFAVAAPRISAAEISQAMHRALAAAQQERPITETREKDLVRAQQERPIDIIIKEDLEAAKAKLSLPGGEQELLISTLGEADEAGVVDPEAQKALLERANELLQEKYQMILDDYSARIAKRGGAGAATASA
jgi:hypothetical protein